MAPIKFKLGYFGAAFIVLVNIYAEDGTVAVSHGGVEMGQGINTKVAQVAAKVLGIPMERIKIKPCSSMTNANTFASSRSFSSELCCLVSNKLYINYIYPCLYNS